MMNVCESGLFPCVAIDRFESDDDLIAGMLGETDYKWKYAVDKALALDPDSVTIYQMEVPFNSKIAKDALAHGGVSDIAGWETKRRWVDEAFGDPEGILIVDESGVAKGGDKSVGVARQYCGATGKIDNCQIGVFLAYASRHGQTLLDTRLMEL